MRMPWASIVLAGVLAEAAAILALVLIVALIGPSDAAAAQAYAEHLGQWVGPIGGAAACLVAGFLVARTAAGVELATGTAVGVVAAMIDVAILAAAGAPFQPLFIVSNAGRILAGGIGGWLAARGRQSSRLIVVRTIDAPMEIVFRTVADITQFSRALPHIVTVEFLSASRVGVGTRFRETRMMNGKQNVTELEVTVRRERSRPAGRRQSRRHLGQRVRGRRRGRAHAVDDDDGCANQTAGDETHAVRDQRHGQESGRGRHGHGPRLLRTGDRSRGLS